MNMKLGSVIVTTRPVLSYPGSAWGLVIVQEASLDCLEKHQHLSYLGGRLADLVCHLRSAARLPHRWRRSERP